VRWYEADRMPVSHERVKQFNYLIPMKEWPLDRLMLWKERINNKRNHMSFWGKLNIWAFYAGLYITFLFNIIGAFFVL